MGKIQTNFTCQMCSGSFNIKMMKPQLLTPSFMAIDCIHCKTEWRARFIRAKGDPSKVEVSAQIIKLGPEYQKIALDQASKMMAKGLERENEKLKIAEAKGKQDAGSDCESSP